MKITTLLLFCLFPVSAFSQTLINGPWTIECGASTANAFTKSASFNFRYISPRYKWSNDDIDEDDKKSEKFKNTRLMLEIIYTPPFKVLCTSFNVQSRIIRYKKFSMEIYGGMKFFFVTGRDYKIPNTRGVKKGDVWYMNLGLLWQVDLGRLAPFADIGGDKIITIGTEVHFQSIYRKPKRRYKLLTENR